MQLETSLPRSLTAPRLRQILELTQPQIDRLTRSLNRRVAHVWRAGGYDDQEFCQSLAGFIGTAEGLTRYQEAAREVQNEVPGWRLTIDGAIFRGIRKRFVVHPDFIAIFPFGVAAEIQPGDFDNIRRFLAASEHWSQLAEFAWATALGTGSATFLKESAEAYAQVAEELDETPEGTTAAAEEPGGEPQEALPRRLPERGERGRGHRDHAGAQQPPSQGNRRREGGGEPGIHTPDGGAAPPGPGNQPDPQPQIHRHHQLRRPQEAPPTDSQATLAKIMQLPRLRGRERRVSTRRSAP